MHASSPPASCTNSASAPCRFGSSAAIWLTFALTALLAACGTPAGGTAAVKQSCVAANDCPSGQVCTGGFCAAKQCDTANPCATGKTCVSGTCVSLSGGDAGNSDTLTFDTGTTTDVTTGGSDDVSTQPEDIQPGTDTTTDPLGKNCLTCTVDADCGDSAYQCVTLLNGNYCAKKCSTAGECPAAFTCDKADSKATNSNCLPPSYQCDGCLVTPCAKGESCVPSTGKCAVVKAQCDECVAQTDCAPGLKCVKLGASKVCAPTCDNNGPCPETSSCQKTTVGNICAFSSDTCCYGPSCTPASGCSSCPTKCFGGACVDCLADGDCSGGKCDVNKHTCITSGPCTGSTPIKLANGQCVECANDTHCASSGVGPKCDLATNKCAASTASNECKACVDPFPGCVQLNGTWSCVECSTDADCAAKDAGTCNSTTYSCSGTTGTGTGPKTGNCKADTDCVNAGTTTFTLACDTASGLCYDTAGKCDNIIAFCNASKGSNCVQPSSVGGLPGGLPLPGGTGTNPGEGVCSCGASGTSGGGGTPNPMCAMLAPTCNCATNPTDPACSPIPGLVECCGGTGGGTGSPLDIFACLTPSPNAPDCFGGLSCTCDLFSSLGGASGGSSAPKNCGTGTGGITP